MKYCRRILIASLGLLNGWTVLDAAQTAPIPTNAVVISTELIRQLAEEARTNHPVLRGAELRVRMAELGVGSVRTWEDPVASIGGSAGGKSFRPSEDGDLTYSIEQKLPLWGKPEAARQTAEASLGIRRAESEFRRQQSVRNITRGLLMTALAERALAITEEDIVWLEATFRTVEVRYRTGQVPLSDALQIQNELAKRHDQFESDYNRLAHEQISLNRLLNRAEDIPWPPLLLPELAPVLPFDDELVALALKEEPRLKILEAEIREVTAAAELTRKMRLPDVSLGLEGKQYHGDGGIRSGAVTLSFSLPLGNADKYRKEYLRELERRNAAEADRQEQILTIREALHGLSLEIDAAYRSAVLYGDEIVPRTEQALANRLAEWQAGRGLLREVLDTRRMLLEGQLLEAQALATQAEAFANAVLWTGQSKFEDLLPYTVEPSLVPRHNLH